MMRTARFLLVLGAMVVLAGPAAALPLIVDYTGFSWASPNSGDPQEFEAVGVIDGFSLPVNDPLETYTFHLSNLALDGVETYSGTQRTYTYTGGDLSLFRSTDPASRPYDYGTNPPNGTAPGSFTDGVLWLGGGLTDFSIYEDDVQQLAILTAQGQFGSGEFLGSLDGGAYFSFAGMTARPGNGIPEGYDYRLDGQLEVNTAPVPEPMAIWLLGGGLVGVLIVRRRRT